MDILRIAKIWSVSVRHEGLNSKVERLNGAVRDREVVMRGMNTSVSAEQLIEAMRIIYNFCRVHQSTKKTPAEMAGLKLKLDANKIESLIRIAAKNKV